MKLFFNKLNLCNIVYFALNPANKSHNLSLPLFLRAQNIFYFGFSDLIFPHLFGKYLSAYDEYMAVIWEG